MNKKGFTLIELMIAIILIGILITIILPVGFRIISNNNDKSNVIIQQYEDKTEEQSSKESKY